MRCPAELCPEYYISYSHPSPNPICTPSIQYFQVYSNYHLYCTSVKSTLNLQYAPLIARSSESCMCPLSGAVPYGDALALNVSAEDNSISMELAVSVARYFQVSETEAAQAVNEIHRIIDRQPEILLSLQKGFLIFR